MVMNKPVSYTKFAKIYGVSQPMVSKYVANGSITERSLIKRGKRTFIVPNLAIEDLKKNMDSGQRKKSNDKISIDWQVLDLDAVWFKFTNENVVKKIIHALGTIAFIGCHFKPKYQKQIFRGLDEIAGVFIVKLVNPDGSTWRDKQ